MFWRKKEQEVFSPCKRTVMWLWDKTSGGDWDKFVDIITNQFGGELCHECETHWVFDGQWWRSVADEDMHKVYQRMANGVKHKYLTDGLTYYSCEECAVDWETDYVKHLARRYDTWGAWPCDSETCVYCADEEGDE